MILQKQIPLILLAVIAIPLISQAQQAAPEQDSPRYVRASGQANVSVKPDQAEINIGVVSEADTAEAAAAANARQSTKVLDQLKQVVGSGADIRTVSYSVHPRYRNTDGRREPEIAGFTATNMVRVKVDDLGKVGKVIDTATQTGANQIHGIQFGLRDEQKARAQALQQATKAAMANAEAMAAAVGAKPSRIRSVEEQSSTPIQPLRGMEMAMARAQAAPPTPVEPGTIEVQASVTITIEIE